MITLRLAKQEDALLLREWDKRPHLQHSSDPDEDWEYEEQLAINPIWRDWWMAELAGRPIGFLQIMILGEDPDDYWDWSKNTPRTATAIDIWIGEPDCLNKGYGSQMMKQAIEKSFADPAITDIFIDPLASNTAAHRFYEKCGFSFEETRTFGTDHCFVFKLNRADWRNGDLK